MKTRNSLDISSLHDLGPEGIETMDLKNQSCIVTGKN